MKTLLIIVIIGILAILGYAVLPKPEDNEVRYGVPAPTYAWEQYLGEEYLNTRTHITKHYPDDKVIIQSSELLHYYDGGFKDLLPLPFPEGKEIEKQADKHFMMNLPEWGIAGTLNDGKIVIVFDETEQPIYVFKNPLVVEKGKNPYKVIKDGKKIRETKDRKEALDTGEKIEKNDDAIDAEFVLEGKKMYFKLPEGLNYPLEAYDDTDTSSTNAKDTMIFEGAAYRDISYGDHVNLIIVDHSIVGYVRSLISFDLIADPGNNTITDITLHLYESDQYTLSGTCDVHPLTQKTSWVEGTYSDPCLTGEGATWNYIDCDGTAWAGGGAEGDYGAVIDGITIGAGDAWRVWQVMGDDNHSPSGTPLTLDWGDPLHLLIKMNIEGAANDKGAKMYSKEGTNVPFITITYSETPPEVKKKVLPPIEY